MRPLPRRRRAIRDGVGLPAAVYFEGTLRTGGVFLVAVGDRLSLAGGVGFEAFPDVGRKVDERDEFGTAGRTVRTYIKGSRGPEGCGVRVA